MTNKLTYNTALTIAIAEVKDAEVVEKLEALKTSLARKSKSGERKPTATQLANDKFKVAILDFMQEGVNYRATDIQKGCEALGEMSNQRVSALLRQLKDANLVTRSEVRGKAYFSKN